MFDSICLSVFFSAFTYIEHARPTETLVHGEGG